MTARLPDRTSSTALLIGASWFVSSAISQLPAVANNVRALASTLTDPTTGVIDAEQCVTLVDPRFPHEVGAALDHATNAAADTVIVYYAGHGLLTPRGVLHLAVAETNPDQVAYTAVPMDWLRSVLAESPARNRILILDCCYSGHAATTMTSISSAVSAAIDVSGTYTLTSAPANSTALAPLGSEFTAFTGELLNVLHDGIPEAGDLLSMRDVYIELVRRLYARSLPRPQHLGTGLADLIAISPNTAAERSLRNRTSVIQNPPEPAPHQERSSSHLVRNLWVGWLITVAASVSGWIIVSLVSGDAFYFFPVWIVGPVTAALLLAMVAKYKRRRRQIGDTH